MSYHSELDAAQRPSDDALAAAEQRGARAALTRLIEDLRDEWYPAPRVRAVVNGEVGTTWTLRNDCWQASHFGALPRRSEVSAMHALQQRADAEGFVTEEGLGATETAPESRSNQGQSAPASPAPTPAPREWWGVVHSDGTLTVSLRKARGREIASGWGLPLVHIREVRPLSEAEVEALARAIGAEWEMSVTTMARAALRHLNIPYEEA